MKREQIIKALECCYGKERCSDCPFYMGEGITCNIGLGYYAYSLIKELTEERKDFEIRALRAENQAGIYQDRYETAKVDNERLTEENERLRVQNEKWQTVALKQEDIMQTIAQEKQAYYDELLTIRDDTVREFQAKITADYAVSKVHYVKDEAPIITYQLTNLQLDQIAKEILNKTEDEKK